MTDQGSGTAAGQLGDAEWLRARYEDDGLSLRAVARLAGASPMTVLHALRRHGVPTRPAVPDRPPAPLLADTDWLRDAYTARRLTVAQVAREAGTGVREARRALVAAGIGPRRQGPHRPLLDDAGWLAARYTDDGLTLQQTADLAGASEAGVRAALVRHGIPVRPRGRRKNAGTPQDQ